MVRSLSAKIKAVFLYAVAAAASAVTNYFDTIGGGSVVFVVNLGAFAYDNTNKLTFNLLHKDAVADSGVAVDAEDVVYKLNGQEVSSGEISSGNVNGGVLEIHYIGYKRLVAVNIVEGGTVAAPVSITAIQGHLDLAPSQAGVV